MRAKAWKKVDGDFLGGVAGGAILLPMTHPRSIPDPARLRALAAQGRLWLVEIMAWLCELFGHGAIGAALRAEALRDLTCMRRGVGAILGLLALQQLPRDLATPRARRPANAPPGFRRSGGCEAFRAAIRLIKPGRGLRGRIGALARVLDNLDVWVARMAKRIARTGLVAAFVMVRAPVDACIALTLPRVAVTDTS